MKPSRSYTDSYQKKLRGQADYQMLVAGSKILNIAWVIARYIRLHCAAAIRMLYSRSAQILKLWNLNTYLFVKF